MAPAALVQPAAAPAQTHPASDLALALTRPAMKMTIALSLSWTRSLRTRAPIRTRYRVRVWGKGRLSRISHRLPLVSHRGDPEKTGVGEAPLITQGGSQLLAAETLSDRSPIHSHSHYDTQTISATRQLPAEGTDDLTPVRIAPNVSPTPPTSADTFYATQESDCIPVSSVTRASLPPLSLLFTLAHTQVSGLLAAHSAVNVLPAVGT